MSAPLYTLIADELGISDAQAKKLLSAMLKEIRKRAQTGVRLPDLGKFKDVDGQLHFEPSESLARAVNHRFEGLDEEDLGSAPVQDDEEEKNQGPSTITLGYQDAGWSPLESSETESTSDDEADEDGADTAEFQVPDADEAADTEELQVDTDAPSPSTSADSARNEASSPRSAPAESHAEPDTEELYPLVEDDSDDPPDAPEPSSPSSDTANTTSPTSEEEHDSLSGIWDSDDDEELDSSPSYDAEPSSSVEPSSSAATDSFSFEEEQPNRDATATSAAPADSPSEDRPEPSPDRADEKSSSSAPRIFVSLLVLLLLGGGAWYILGQRGLVPTPRTTFAQLSTTVQSLTAGAPSSSTESPPPDTDTTASTDASAEESTSQSGDASAQSTDSSSSSNAQSAASADSIDPSAGGWSIVVASRAESDAAESLAQTYRDRFVNRDVPVDVIEGTVNNSTRYRVGIGQFDSQSDAQSFLKNFDSKLPDGAWSLNLQ